MQRGFANVQSLLDPLVAAGADVSIPRLSRMTLRELAGRFRTIHDARVRLEKPRLELSQKLVPLLF
jgi:hypothetical protein